jgi:type VI secretion system protein ImpC
MPQRDVFSQVHVDVRAGAAPDATPADDTPFCLAVLGDFGGREGSGRPPAVPGPLLVDRDDLDAVLARLAPEATLELGGTQRLRFRAIEDFHPDRLLEGLPLFAALRETRRRLADPRTFADVAAGLRAPAPAPPSAERRQATAERLATGSLLDDILDATPGGAPGAHPGETAPARPSGSVRAPGELASFLRDVVRPHLVPGPDPRQHELLASVDAAVAALLRLVLRHPQVRALERRWRGVELLVRRLETGPSLRVVLFDVTRAELAAGVAGAARDGALFERLQAGASALPGAAPWAALVGLYDFADTPADVALLDRLARLGEACGAPWLGTAAAALARGAPPEPHDAAGPPAEHHPAAAGGTTSAPTWAAVRRAPHARWLGLAFPALLLRLPYGADGELTETPDFEELEPGLDTDAATERLLWGDAALVPALVLGAAFAADGWRLRPGAHLEVGRLPLHLHRGTGGVEAVPPTGGLLTDRDVERLLDRGVMPLVARPQQDAVRLARLQSVAEPAAALAGRWATASA